MPQPIGFTPQSYTIAGSPTYFYSGEFHYFRVPRADWRRRMRLFKEAGGVCLATYVPWLLHEPEEGRFAFGETAEWLDLEGFLQTAADEGLYVLARPGPYQYSELVNDGLPGWLLDKYPQVLARTVDGRTFRASSISYLHPLFLEKVQNWFDAVCPILARHTLERGGALALLQLDNELVGIHEWFGTLDYHPDTMGFGQPEGRFPRFLARRYGSAAALNQAYASAFPTLEAVPPPQDQACSSANIRRRKDYFDFYLATIAEYCTILAKMLRKHGLDQPLLHNSGNPSMNAYFLETSAALGSEFLLGSDHYYSLDQNWPQNNPTPQYAVRSFVSLEMLRLMGYPPSVLELPGGSASDWPPVTPSDALAAYMTNLALGMKGSNFYIFTGGPNPPGAGTTTDLYDYGAGISAAGEVRPLYHTQAAFGAFLAEHAWFAQAGRAADLRVGLDYEHFRANHYWTERGGFLFSHPDARELLRRGPLTTAFCAGLSPALVDLRRDDWLADSAAPLLVVSSLSMGRELQRRLVRFLQGGGRLLLLPVLPELDENMQPCTLLADCLGAAGGQRRLETARTRIGNVVNVLGEVYVFNQVPAEARVVGMEERSGQALAWRRDFAGGGAVICLGLAWSHAMREQERALVYLLNELGLRQILHSSNPNVWAALWVHERKGLLFLMNLLSAPMDVEVTFQLEADGARHTTGPVHLEPVTVRGIDFALDAGNPAVFPGDA